MEPTFFEPQDWVAQTADWQAPMQSDKQYELTRGEGLRVWEACRHRAQAAQPVGQARYRPPRLVPPRLRQGTFRIAVSEAYDWGCAVSQEHSVPALDEAHIRPVEDDGPYSVSNGLLLRADIHRLFDRGYVTVTPDLHVEVSGRLREDYENGRSYYPFHGGMVRTPQRFEDRPTGSIRCYYPCQCGRCAPAVWTAEWRCRIEDRSFGRWCHGRNRRHRITPGWLRRDHHRSMEAPR
uniref:HNH nuclease domain-containing protein n=1 Tax=uncultured marine microorganism HF4000_010I05 TaxID=455517 RepID=B3T1L0_9ZZZZ|nr:hypothetical protein ALOHA_HF4000010I05ctg1g33 [uncultured marine microorganism HF4000_010I05]